MDKSQEEIQKPKNWFESLDCAIEGAIFAVKTERHMRYHYVIAAVILLTSLLLNLTTTEFLIFALSIVLLLFAEMFNTAIEHLGNIIWEKHHIFIKQAKDIAAGAVLISSIGVFLTSYVIFSKYLYRPAELFLIGVKTLSGHIAIISLLFVFIAVVFSKAYLHKGRPLHGGMPSGHSAVAFSLWVSISLITVNPLVTILSFVMAVMVSQSRLIGRIHTFFEVFMGALLGAGLTFLIFYLFSNTL
ncbi:MAG: diacylglycerol kinase [Deltaproteobacteria bacterium]|nr:diacylglycerol kinase [Deltaproteobacteria bacterium]